MLRAAGASAVASQSLASAGSPLRGLGQGAALAAPLHGHRSPPVARADHRYQQAEVISASRPQSRLRQAAAEVIAKGPR